LDFESKGIHSRDPTDDEWKENIKDKSKLNIEREVKNISKRV